MGGSAQHVSAPPAHRAPRSYVAITPARNEVDNLRRLADALQCQTVAPEEWIIVENGSTDGTLELARELQRRIPYVRVVQMSGEERYDRGRAYIRVVHAGVEVISGSPDVVVKLDADVGFAPDFFERILEAFAADPWLGVTSGSCWEHDGVEWRQRSIRGAHVWGPTRAYRWPECAFLFPLDESLGYAAVDETKAMLAGWRTGTQHDLRFDHHRPEGMAESSRGSAWRLEGEAAYYLGYRPSYLLARAGYRMLGDRHAAAIVGGYWHARANRETRLADHAVRDKLRESQRLRHVASRARISLRALRARSVR